MYFLDKRQDEVKQMITIIIHKHIYKWEINVKEIKITVFKVQKKGLKFKVACYWSFEEENKTTLNSLIKMFQDVLL